MVSGEANVPPLGVVTQDNKLRPIVLNQHGRDAPICDRRKFR
jgi:hypothetical protein